MGVFCVNPRVLREIFRVPAIFRLKKRILSANFSPIELASVSRERGVPAGPIFEIPQTKKLHEKISSNLCFVRLAVRSFFGGSTCGNDLNEPNRRGGLGNGQLERGDA